MLNNQQWVQPYVSSGQQVTTPASPGAVDNDYGQPITEGVPRTYGGGTVNVTPDQVRALLEAEISGTGGSSGKPQDVYRREVAVDEGKLQLDILEFQAEQDYYQWKRAQDAASAAASAGNAAAARALQQQAMEAEQRWKQAQLDLQYAQLQLQEREMGANIGRDISQLAAQTWAQGLPTELPRETTTPPGGELGGPASVMARMGGAQYSPQRIRPSEPPSPEEMSDWIEAAIQRFATGVGPAPSLGPMPQMPSMGGGGGVSQQPQQQASHRTQGEPYASTGRPLTAPSTRTQGQPYASTGRPLTNTPTPEEIGAYQRRQQLGY